MSGRLLKVFPVVKETDSIITQDTDIFPNDLVPTRPAIFRILVAFSAAVVLYMTGLSTTRLALNNGNALDADELFAFDISVRNGDQLNFQISAGATIRIFDVVELIWGAP